MTKPARGQAGMSQRESIIVVHVASRVKRCLRYLLLAPVGHPVKPAEPPLPALLATETAAGGALLPALYVSR
jgi:hypothetical protein